MGNSKGLRHHLLYQFDNIPIEAHSGIKATYAQAKQHFYWLDMKKLVT